MPLSPQWVLKGEEPLQVHPPWAVGFADLAILFLFLAEEEQETIPVVCA